MKFSINKTELQNAIAIVLKGVSTRSTLPVLSGILLDASNDTLTLQSTDLELSIQFSLPALIEEEGKAVVPGKLFSDIVKNLPDAAIQVEASDDQAYVTCDASSFVIKILSFEDFPAFPTVAIQQRIEIPFEEFSKMVRRVAKVVSKDESRAVLTGVLITMEENLLRMVATDSYRLAITEATLPQATDTPFEAVIAGSFLTDIASLSKSNTSVSLALAENQIVVNCGDTIFINRRIEGNFPNYKQLIPNGYTTRATIAVDNLVAGVRRASLLGSNSAPVKFDLNIASQTLQLSANTQDVGNTQEIIRCGIEGEDVAIAFNYSYVLDGLASVSTNNVYMEIQSPLKPGIFRSEEPENYLYLVMPVRIS